MTGLAAVSRERLPLMERAAEDLSLRILEGARAAKRHRMLYLATGVGESAPTFLPLATAEPVRAFECWRQYTR
jgi:hypothetical protein